MHRLIARFALALLLCVSCAPTVRAAEAPPAVGGAPELVLNIDHVGEITALAVSPDSATVASASRDGTVKLWDAATGKLIRSLTGHRDWVLSVAFSADGAAVYAGGRDGTVKAWAVKTGRLLGTFTGSGAAPAAGSVTAISAQPVPSPGGGTGLLLARATGPENAIQLTRIGAPPLEPIPPLTGHLKTVRVLAFSPDGKLLASGSDDGMIKLWDAEDGSLQRSLKGYAMPVTALAFSADSKRLLSGSDDGIAYVWDVASGKQQQELQMNRPGDGVGAVAMSPDNAAAVTGGHGGSRGHDFVMLWNAQTAQQTRVLSGHEAYVTAAAFSPDGRFFVTGSRDNTVRIWDRASAGQQSVAAGSRARIPAVSCDPAGALIASADTDGTARLWNAHTGALTRVVAGHTGAVLAVALSPDGKTLATGGDDKSVRLWVAPTGEPLRTLAGATGRVNTLAFSPDGATLAAGTGSDDADGAVAFWDVATGARRQTFSGEALGMVRALCFSPDGTLLLTASDTWGGGELHVWDAATGKSLLKEESGPIRALAFSPDGKQFAVGSATYAAGERTGEEIRLWNARTREPQRTLTAPEPGGGNNAITYTDNATLVSGSRAGALRIWNARTGELTQTLSGHVGAVLTLISDLGFRISDLGTGATGKAPVSGTAQSEIRNPKSEIPGLVVSGGLDNTIRLWRIGGGASGLLATLIALPVSVPGAAPAESWIALTPQGFYDGAPGAERRISWRVGGDLFPVEAYETTFHRPEMIRRALSGEVLPETGEVERFSRGAAVPPQIQFQAPQDGQSIAGAKTIRVDLAVTDARKVTRVELFTNGRPIQAKPIEVAAKPLEVGAKPLEVGAKPLEVGAKPLEVAAKPLEIAAKPIPLAHRMLQQFQVEVPLPAGEPQVTLAALAYNEESLQSRAEVRLSRGGEAGSAVPAAGSGGTLYVLAVGVSQYANPNYNLKYAAHDAAAFGDLWGQAGGSALYQNVSVTRLVDAEATAPAVRAALFRILENATESDTVALFLSGHGVQVGDSDYYFATHEIDAATAARVAETALPWKVLQTTLAAVKARRVLLFLDACHSGNALGTQQAENERLAELLVKRAGVLAFASSRGSEYSYELDDAGHGAFTAALIEAISGGKADLEIGGRRDGVITAEELLVYLRTRVPQLTQNRQTPSCPLLRDFGDAFPVARVR